MLAGDVVFYSLDFHLHRGLFLRLAGQEDSASAHFTGTYRNIHVIFDDSAQNHGADWYVDNLTRRHSRRVRSRGSARKGGRYLGNRAILQGQSEIP